MPPTAAQELAPHRVDIWAYSKGNPAWRFVAIFDSNGKRVDGNLDVNEIEYTTSILNDLINDPEFYCIDIAYNLKINNNRLEFLKNDAVFQLELFKKAYTMEENFLNLFSNIVKHFNLSYSSVSRL
jgi:hypothetical protein